MAYCIYLRKSRADFDAEVRGEGETLARHENLLLEVARRDKLNVTQIYREIVSGETIAARPVMQHLLQEIEQGCWEGVLVVEVERLARGDTIDQGIMAQTFKYSGAKIITPLKVYDPENEYDEEYFEFGLFMSRREYKTINRRLLRGKVAAAKEGKWVCGRAPYGYKHVRLENDKGWTLVPVSAAAAVVRLIFKLYTEGEQSSDGSVKRFGTDAIAIRLDTMGIAPPGKSKFWRGATVKVLLSNPAYIGKVRWHTHRVRKRIVDSKLVKEIYSPPPEERILVNGLHPALIPDDVFYSAQTILARKGPPPVRSVHKVVNPLAGLIICGKCGLRMVLHPSGSIQCPNRNCDNVSAKCSIIEGRILQALSGWLSDYRLAWSDNPFPKEQESVALGEKAVRKVRNDIETLRQQLARTHDLLEQGVYDIPTFLQRSQTLTSQIESAEKQAASLSSKLDEIRTRMESRKNIIPKVEKLLEVYSALPSAQAKNEMLKEIIEKAVYVRLKRSGRCGTLDNFDLVVYPKLPPGFQD